MSLKLSYPERTNLYLTNLNNKSKIEIFIPDGVLKCEDHEDFYINVIQFNTFHSFYNVIEGYNNNFNIIIDNSTNIICSIPSGNITAYTIREYINKVEPPRRRRGGLGTSSSPTQPMTHLRPGTPPHGPGTSPLQPGSQLPG